MALDNNTKVNIIGAGLSGLSAAITLAKAGIASNLISQAPSERAQSVLAEGGINGALNTMGEDDTPENHYNDTLKAGVYLANEEAVRKLCEGAPEILRHLQMLGVAFNLSNEDIMLRKFGGQKKKRTAYAKSSTGKIVMSAIIDEARKYEAIGLITRYDRHEFTGLNIENNNCKGVYVSDIYSGDVLYFPGIVILCFGGMNGLFPKMTTGTVLNSSDALARVFSQGVKLSNLEMIQYHPTTMGISDKRCLVSEAARAEGGRLFVKKNGNPWYFMEEKFPELGNLMPRDVVSREEYLVVRKEGCEAQVYLDMSSISEDIWKSRLSDLREEIIHYQGIDPKIDPIPVNPGIHYFMGGVDVDVRHRSNINNLYAAGECCSLYHGANRLGGNSMLGAIYGGSAAAKDIIESSEEDYKEISAEDNINRENIENDVSIPAEVIEYAHTSCDKAFENELRDVLLESAGIVRDASGILEGLDKVSALLSRSELNLREKNRIALASAILKSAELRKESRGAHFRSDYPNLDESQAKMIIAAYKDEPEVYYEEG